MKRLRLLLLLSVCLFIGGCVGNGLTYKIYDSTGTKLIETVDVKNLGGMNNAKTDKLEITIETKSGFKTKLKLTDRDVTHSPESMRAMGDAGANVMTGGASETVKSVLEQ